MATNTIRDRSSAAGWHARPPAGWEPIGEICGILYERIDELTTELNEAIGREVAGFGTPGGSLTREDLDWSTRRNLAAFLHGVAEDRAPTEDEIEFRRLVGRRSAMRGVALQPLMTAFHIAYRDLWLHLVEQAEGIGGDAPALLPRSSVASLRPSGPPRPRPLLCSADRSSSGCC